MGHIFPVASSELPIKTCRAHETISCAVSWCNKEISWNFRAGNTLEQPTHKEQGPPRNPYLSYRRPIFCYVLPLNIVSLSPFSNGYWFGGIWKQLRAVHICQHRISCACPIERLHKFFKSVFHYGEFHCTHRVLSIQTFFLFLRCAVHILAVADLRHGGVEYKRHF